MDVQAHVPRLKTQHEIAETLSRLPVPAFVFEVASGKFLRCNSAFQELIGYNETELLSMRVEAIQPETHIADCHTARGAAPPQGLLRWQYCCKDGSLLDVKVHYRDVLCVGDAAENVSGRFVVVEFWQPAADA